LLYFSLVMSRDVAFDSEDFIHIFGQKQKLPLSKPKSVILQLNIRCNHNCYTDNANKTKCLEFI